MKINKYLREIGINENSYPFKIEDDRYKEDEEGFSVAQFFDLDHTFDLIIYSRLCYFREHCADIVTPGCFLYTKKGYEKKNGHNIWLKTLDKIIEGFKINLAISFPNDNEQKKIIKARKLFIKYYDCLWY